MKHTRIVVSRYGGPQEHPPPLPFTPGWDLIGVVDRLGDGVSGAAPGQIFGGAQRFCLTDARQAHELLGKGGVIGKIVLVTDP